MDHIIMKPHSYLAQCKVLILLTTLAVLSCDSMLSSKTDSADDRALISSEIASTQVGADPGLIMRERLRTMPDGEFINFVENSGLVVTVGFKEVNQLRGVSRLGEALVSRALTETLVNEVADKFAESVIYRFKHIPAVAIRLPNAEMALQLRSLPWVDYVTAGSGLVTPDALVQGCEPITSPQVMPWHIPRINADAAWIHATGGGAPKRLVMLDDGANEDGNSWYDAELYWEALTNYVPGSWADGEHGTGVLGAVIVWDNDVGTVGVAPDAIARVMKVYDRTTGNPEHEAWEVHSAIAVDDNATLATVITISASTQITTSEPPPSFVNFYDAITNAYYQHNVLFAASTGNQGSPEIYSFPANFQEVIGVGGSGYDDEYVLNNHAPGNVELAAPAVDILTICGGGV